MTITADVKCYYCGDVSGKVTGPVGGPFRVSDFEPRESYRGQLTPRMGKLRCFRCNGPVFLDDVQQIRSRVQPVKPRRTDPRVTTPLKKAS